MDLLYHDFKQAHLLGSGPLLATTLSPVAPVEDPGRLQRIAFSSTQASVTADIRSGLLSQRDGGTRLSKQEGNAWADIYVIYWRAVYEIVSLSEGSRADHGIVYELWKDLTDRLIKGYSANLFGAWTVPCLYVAGRYLRVFAINADKHGRGTKSLTFDVGLQDDVTGSMSKNGRLEDAARIINRIFTLCISDRAPLESSRKWGLYYTINLLFKTYFKLNSISLSKNILRAIQASHADMPPLESFPKAHIVTFEYYVGVISFLDENYEKAEEHLTKAWKLCHPNAKRNQELIMTYLIPCHLLTTHTLPSKKLLEPYPRLKALFTGLGQCIRKGDLAGFDKALAAGEDEFVKRRIYLTLERGRDIALRNLLRKVYLAGGFEESKDGGPPVRRTRIPVSEFTAAIRLGTNNQYGHFDTDEAECLLANMIYKSLVKGYIARERGIVVLSKGSAFPGTGV